MFQKPARRRRLNDPNAAREAREENARQEADVAFPPDSLSPDERAEEAEDCRRAEPAVRQAEDRLAAVRLTPTENALVQLLGGAFLLRSAAWHGREVRYGEERSVPYLVTRLYGAKWSRLGRRSRRLMLGRLRTLRHRANAKLAEVSLAIVPEFTWAADERSRAAEHVTWCLARTDLHDPRREGDNNQAGRIFAELEVREWARMHGVSLAPEGPPGRLQAVPECAAYLRERLASAPVESRRVLRECRDRGFRPSTIRNARRLLKVVATHGEGYGADGEWWLSLPGRP
jgi:hypothetical protein